MQIEAVAKNIKCHTITSFRFFSIMKNNITELVFILDRSGSMAGL